MCIATVPHSGIGSGPLFLQDSFDGSGLGFQFAITFAPGTTPIAGGTLLGSITIDDVDDFDDLQTMRSPISSAGASLFGQAGGPNPWSFDFGNYRSPVTGGQQSAVEVHYQCGSPDIYCWGSIDDFIGLMSGAQSGQAVDILRDVSFATMDAAGGMTNVPVSSAYLVSQQSFVLGDFNNDNLVDCDDIDLMRDAVLNMTSDASFDVDGVGGDIPTEADVAFLISDIIGSGCGDGDLNKVINFQDFVFVANNFGQVGTGWKEGNFNLDNVTNFADFAELSNRFGMTFPVAPTPEPTALAMLCLGVLAALPRR